MIIFYVIQTLFLLALMLISVAGSLSLIYNVKDAKNYMDISTSIKLVKLAEIINAVVLFLTLLNTLIYFLTNKNEKFYYCVVIHAFVLAVLFLSKAVNFLVNIKYYKDYKLLKFYVKSANEAQEVIDKGLGWTLSERCYRAEDYLDEYVNKCLEIQSKWKNKIK